MDKDLQIQQLEEALVLLIERRHPEWFQGVTDELGSELMRYEKRMLDLQAKLRKALDDYHRCRTENVSLQDTNAALFDSVSKLLKNEEALMDEQTRLRAREEELGQEISAKNEEIHSLEIKCEENVELRLRLEEAEEKLAVLETERNPLTEQSSRDPEHQNEHTSAEQPGSDELVESDDGMGEETSSGLLVDSYGLEDRFKALTDENALLRHQAIVLAADKSKAVMRILELDSLLRSQSAHIQENLATSKSAKNALSKASDKLKELNRQLRNKDREITELHFDLGEQDRRCRVRAGRRIMVLTYLTENVYNATETIASLRDTLRNKEQEALLERSILLDHIAGLKMELQHANTESRSSSTLSSVSENVDPTLSEASIESGGVPIE